MYFSLFLTPNPLTPHPMATLQVRIPDKQLKDLRKLFESLGLDLTTAVRIFFARSAACHGLPFPVRKDLTVNGFTPEFEAEVLKAAKDDDLSPAFDNADDAIAYLRSFTAKP